MFRKIIQNLQETNEVASLICFTKKMSHHYIIADLNFIYVSEKPFHKPSMDDCLW